MNDLPVAELVSALGKVAFSVQMLAIVVGASFVVGYVTILVKGGSLRPKSDLFRFNVERAVELYETGKLDKLIDYAKTCLDKYPNDVDARWYLGVGYYSVERFGEALGEFERVVQLNPHWKEPAAPYIEEINQKLDMGFARSHEEH